MMNILSSLALQVPFFFYITAEESFTGIFFPVNSHPSLISHCSSSIMRIIYLFRNLLM